MSFLGLCQGATAGTGSFFNFFCYLTGSGTKVGKANVQGLVCLFSFCSPSPVLLCFLFSMTCN